MTDSPIDTNAIRIRIKQMMDEMGVNAATFADQAEITRSVISNIVNERNNATLETINKLLAAYPTWSKSWLLFGEGTPHHLDERERIQTTQGERGLFTSGGIAPAALNISSSLPSTSSTPFNKESLTELVKETVRAITENTAPAERAIAEIRVFYSDGSFEVFKKT